MHIDGRSPGTPPNTLLDYFPEDFLLINEANQGAENQQGQNQNQAQGQGSYQGPAVLDPNRQQNNDNNGQ